MKNVTLVTTALICACLIAAGTASAQEPQRMVPEPAPVAGFSPNFADHQPITGSGQDPWPSLTRDANRLVRWQGWLDVDAFSTSVLNQMQKRVANGDIKLGEFTLVEGSIAEAVVKAKAQYPVFIMNDRLNTGENITDVKLYVWLYRHNFADKGLYQLYISAKGRMLIGKYQGPGEPVPHRDIQSLGYEFSGNSATGPGMRDCYADVEIWRGAVVRVDATGAITVVGNEAGVVVGPLEDEPVESAPLALWERAPSLINNPHYNPLAATGAAFVEPLDRVEKISGNTVQQRAGSVQNEQRVRVVTPFRYRNR